MILLVLLLVVGNGNGLGWLSTPVIVGGVAVAILTAGFIWWELRIRAPMLELRLFANQIFGLGVAAAWLSFFGSSAARFMMPFYLQRVLEYSPEQVGLMMIPPAVCMVLIGPFSGRLADRFGWRVPTVCGMALTAAGAFVLAFALQERFPGLAGHRHHDDAELRQWHFQLTQQQQHSQRGGPQPLRGRFRR